MDIRHIRPAAGVSERFSRRSPFAASSAVVRMIGRRLPSVLPVALLALLAFALLPASSGRAQDYSLGQGLWLGKLNLAGYVTVEAENARGEEAKLVVDDLSLFVHGRFSRFFNPFIEAELTGIPLLVEGSDPFSGSKTRAVLERLYNDIVIDDRWTLRLGKALTPIGEWNVIHAGPLVETTSRPLTSFRSFSEFVSGVSLLYQPVDEGVPEVTVYWQPGGELAKNPSAIDQRRFHDMVGGNVSWRWDLENTIGFSFQRAAIAGTRERQTLFGANLHYDHGPFELQVELTRAWLHRPIASRVRKSEFGVYVQGQWMLSERWSAIARYEYFRDRDVLRASRNAVIGIAWRPITPVVWKLEYLEQWGGVLDLRSGVRGSLAILF